MRNRTGRVLLSAALAAGALSTLSGSYGIRQDEFECEEAVLRLLDCCPELPRNQLSCVYASSCGAMRKPDLSPALSQCLQRQGCEVLRGLGACEVGEWRPISTACDGPCPKAVPPCQ